MTKKIARLRMFAGPNGSGKSTFKSMIRPELLGVFVNPDEIEQHIRNDNYLDFKNYQINDGRLHFFDVTVNAYFASVIADFIRHQLMEISQSFTLNGDVIYR